MRWIAITLALFGGVSFALAMQKAWWSVGEGAIGPFGTRACFGGECRETGLSWLGGSDMWMRSAVAVRAAGYIAMFVLIALAGALAAKRIPHVVARLAIVAILTAAATGGYFVAASPVSALAGSSIDLGVFLLVAGCVLGVASVVCVMRAKS